MRTVRCHHRQGGLCASPKNAVRLPGGGVVPFMELTEDSCRLCPFPDHDNPEPRRPRRRMSIDQLAVRNRH